LLERQLASGKPLNVRMRVTARDLPQVRSANVIGEIPGTDLANEIVLVRPGISILGIPASVCRTTAPA
jgi:hypothetical protein